MLMMRKKILIAAMVEVEEILHCAKLAETLLQEEDICYICWMLNVGDQSTDPTSFKALGDPKGACGAALSG